MMATRCCNGLFEREGLVSVGSAGAPGAAATTSSGRSASPTDGAHATRTGRTNWA
jgi:hypothetical protein